MQTLRLTIRRTPGVIRFELKSKNFDDRSYSLAFEIPKRFSERYFLKDWFQRWGRDVQHSELLQDDLGRMLAQAYFPKELALVLAEYADQGICLIIEDEAQQVPWEACRVGEHFLADAFCLVRWFPQLSPRIICQPKQLAIILAEPHNSFWLDEKAALIDHSKTYHIRLQDYSGCSLNLQKLFEASAVDTFHFIGHSYYKPDVPGHAALRLSNKRLLYAYELRAKSTAEKACWPFAFFNSCQSTMSESEHLGVQGFPKAILDSGAGALIGSWWKIPDLYALRFAEQFYREWFAGAELPYAFHRARLKTGDSKNPYRLVYSLFYGGA